MGDLTGKRIDQTYDGLIKTNDEQPIDGTLKALQDGVGNNLPVQVSTSGVNFTGNVTGDNNTTYTLDAVGDGNNVIFEFVGSDATQQDVTLVPGTNVTFGLLNNEITIDVTAGAGGTSGTSGTSGVDGAAGTSGTSGAAGSPGTPGSSGTSGTSGTDGAAGSPGTPGTSGTSGTSGISPTLDTRSFRNIPSPAATVTGTLTDQVVLSITIPGGTFGVGDAIHIGSLGGSFANATVYPSIRIQDISNTYVIAVASGSGQDRSVTFDKIAYINSTTQTNVFDENYNTDESLQGFSNFNVADYSIDWSQDVDIQLTVYTEAGDSYTAYGLWVVSVDQSGAKGDDYSVVTRTGTNLQFDIHSLYNTDTVPGIGNITFNGAGAQDGFSVLLFHNDSVAPTFSVEYNILTGSYPYAINQLNVIHCQYAFGKVYYTISQI